MAGKGDADSEKPEDLTPDLSNVSVPFAEAVLRSADLLAGVAGKVLTKSLEEHGEGEEGLRSLVAAVREQLGLQPGVDDVDVTSAAQLSAAAAGGEVQKEWFEDRLRTLLEAYLRAQAARSSEEASQGAEQAAAGTLKLACRFISGQELLIHVDSDSTVGEVKEKLGKRRRLHASLFRLTSPEGSAAEQGSMLVTDAFPGMVAQVFVSPEVFKVGDRIEAAWSSATDTTGFVTPEDLFLGQVGKVCEEDGVAYYDINWDVVDGHRTRSLVHYENSLWRTAHGGVIYSLTKCEEEDPPLTAPPPASTADEDH